MFMGQGTINPCAGRLPSQKELPAWPMRASLLQSIGVSNLITALCHMESCHCMHLYSCHAIFIPHACMQGTDLLKHGRLGKPKMHFFRLAEADTQLMWRSSNGKQRSIPLASVHQVSADLTTSQLQAFWCCSSPLPIY